MSAERGREILREYCARLEEIFILYGEAKAGFRSSAREIEQAVNDPALSTTLDHRTFYGLDNPDIENARYVAVSAIRNVLMRNAEGGPNDIAMARLSILMAHAAWEHETRPKLALELGVDLREIRSPVFGDLNKYRQAVAHVNGRLDRETEVLNLVAVGSNVNLDKAGLVALFDALVSEANRVAEAYCGLQLNHQFIKWSSNAPSVKWGKVVGHGI